MDKIKIPDSVWESIFNKFIFRENYRTNSSDSPWTGFYLGDRLVIGHQSSDYDGTWYYDGELSRINLMVEFFDLSTSGPLRKSLISFLNKKNGFNIKRI